MQITPRRLQYHWQRPCCVVTFVTVWGGQIHFEEWVKGNLADKNGGPFYAQRQGCCLPVFFFFFVTLEPRVE